MRKNKPTILGTGTVIIAESRIGITYETGFYGNKKNPNFITTLTELGFTISKSTNSIVNAILPMDWKHIRLDKTREVIIDEFGRKRIEIDVKNKTSTLLQRFNFIFTVLRCGNNIIGVEYAILDRESPIEQNIIREDEFEKYVETFAGNEEKAIQTISLVLQETLDEKFPGWKDPLAYW